MSYPNWIPNWKSCSIIQTIKRFDQNTGNLFKFSVKSILIKNRKKNYWKIRIKCISSFYLFTSQSNWKNRISKKNCGQIHFLMIAVVLYVTAFWHWSLQNVAVAKQREAGRVSMPRTIRRFYFHETVYCLFLFSLMKLEGERQCQCHRRLLASHQRNLRLRVVGRNLQCLCPNYQSFIHCRPVVPISAVWTFLCPAHAEACDSPSRTWYCCWLHF